MARGHHKPHSLETKAKIALKQKINCANRRAALGVIPLRGKGLKSKVCEEAGIDPHLISKEQWKIVKHYLLKYAPTITQHPVKRYED